MKTIVSREKRYWDIMIDRESKVVTVTEKWGYIWKNDSDESGWTTSDQANFHAAASRVVREHWSALLWSTSRHEELDNELYSLEFRIKRTNLDDCHWKVEVYRDPTHGSNVNWERNRIQLSVSDTLPTTAYTKTGVAKSGFYIVAHEFGHSLLYGRDEYKKRSRFLDDTASVMNVGTVIRARHYKRLLRHVNRAAIGQKFEILDP